MEYQVKIDAFEGPLDLLLHLINRLEIDIYDIPVAEISEQYLIYINAMTELELDGASEYLVMAATLLAIKSKMLLPKNDNDDDVEEHIYEEEDPRDELVEQLIEYKKFKEAAQALKQKEFERGQMYTKPPSDLSGYAEATHSLPVDFNVSIYDMLGAYHKLVRRKKLKKPISAKISNQEISIDDRMTEILNELANNEFRFSFYDLFPNDDKQHIVITFLAVLELMKRNEINVEQDGIFGEIYLSGRKEAGAVGRF